MANDKTPEAGNAGTGRAPDGSPTRVVWDDSNMATAFANVINVLTTREEFTLLFGTNQTWNSVNNREFTVRLSNRVVLSPYAAKRLATLLQVRVQEYENRFGALNIEA
ncbi:MAG TPA: DUF3467 domain-containing protein [Bauldia sp.]|nr:DUF3467 domain-containing protein [Bauldia sp.]